MSSNAVDDNKYSEIPKSHPIVEEIKSNTSIENIRTNKDLSSFEETFSKAMENENMTMNGYIKLTHTPMSELSETDITQLYAVNSSVDKPMDATLMSKVIPETTYLNCIENGKFSDTVGNCVTRAQDVLGLNENNTFLNKEPYLGTGVTKDVEGGIDYDREWDICSLSRERIQM